MPDTRTYAVVAWVLAGLLLLLALGAAGLGAVGLSTQGYLDDRAVPVRGTVTAADAGLDLVEVSFEVAGSPRRADVAWSGDTPDVGDTVEVEYDPQDLSYARRPGTTTDRDLGRAFLGAAAVLLVASGLSARWAVRRRRAVSSRGR